MSADLGALLEHRQVIVTALALSGDLAPFNGPLYRVVGVLLDRAAIRAERARQRSAARSQAIRRGIRQAAGALPHSGYRGLAGIVQRRILRKGPDFYGLRTIPHLSTIRAELAAMAEERKCAVSALEPNQSADRPRSNTPSTDTRHTDG